MRPTKIRARKVLESVDHFANVVDKARECLSGRISPSLEFRLAGEIVLGCLSHKSMVTRHHMIRHGVRHSGADRWMGKHVLSKR